VYVARAGVPPVASSLTAVTANGALARRRSERSRALVSRKRSVLASPGSSTYESARVAPSSVARPRHGSGSRPGSGGGQRSRIATVPRLLARRVRTRSCGARARRGPAGGSGSWTTPLRYWSGSSSELRKPASAFSRLGLTRTGSSGSGISWSVTEPSTRR